MLSVHWIWMYEKFNFIEAYSQINEFIIIMTFKV